MMVYNGICFSEDGDVIVLLHWYAYACGYFDDVSFGKYDND